MNRINLIWMILMFSNIFTIQAQKVTGEVSSINESGETIYLPGVNIYWAENQEGTTTNTEGFFSIIKTGEATNKLVASFIGYQNDTIEVSNSLHISFQLEPSPVELESFIINENTAPTVVSKLSTFQVQNITGEEFQKAACCNLSESFETNASVDVSFSDAVTGAKRIQLLGLDGKYVQMLSENLPFLRGLSSTFGLSYIPGTWMESIQVSKGTSTVVNGFESITGQINIEFKKPDSDEMLNLNLVSNNAGKYEANMDAAVMLSDKVSTMVYGHYEKMSNRVDHNGDGFLDLPLNQQYHLYNRWKYNNNRHMAQVGFRFLEEERFGGQTGYDFEQTQADQALYGLGIHTRIMDAWAKTGYTFANENESSIAFLNNFNKHEVNSFYGHNNYRGNQLNYNANFIFSTHIWHPNHQYKAGLSYQYDQFTESLNDSTFVRTENVPGIFLEYGYKYGETLSLLAGFRIDNHNIYGMLFTPRFHLKYGINENNIIRFSAGKGYRSANLIAENSFLLAGSRALIIKETPTQEIAWNYGVNYSLFFSLFDREFNINADIYRTDFINQIVVDRDQNSHAIYVYNLNGSSYANSLQVEGIYEVIPRLDMVLAFRYNDVKMTINDQLEREPLVNRYKGLLNFSYETRLKKWQFDVTWQLNGDSRLPNTSDYPDEYRRPEFSEAYSVINAQVSRFFRNWNIYIGSENIGNFTQHNPIIGAEDPFGNFFDSSIVWGPIHGRKFYAGIKYQLKK